MPQVCAAMSRHRQFILYRVEATDRPGKTNKLPIDWRSGRVCSAHDPNVWLSHAEAEQHVIAWGPNHGVGFVFTEGLGLWFLDIDDCLTPEGWTPLAQQLLGALAGCAVEVSLSGRGLHVFGSGTLPAHACKNTALHLELYHTERFVALTGTSLMGDAATVPAPEVLQWLVSSCFAGSAIDAEVNDWRTEPVPEWSGPTDDDELIARMLRAPASAASAFGGGVTVRDLWTANADALGRKWPSASGDDFDRSSADAALASHLAYYTGNNHERMRALMQRSALVRDKWGREGYVADTVQRMAARTTKWLQDRPPATVAAPGAPGDPPVLTFAAAAAGAIPATLEMVRTHLKSSEVDTKVVYDAFRAHIMVGKPGAWRPMTDVDYVRMRRRLEAGGFKPIKSDLMRDVVLDVAMEHTIDTATEWAGALQWDGVPRVADSLVRYFGAAPSPYATAVSLYLWTALAGRAMDPGCQADMALILVGPQGARKSTAVRNIAPSIEFCGSVDLLKVEEDDTARKLRAKLVIELGELRGLKGRDSEAIKDWMTRRVEAWTPKYREFETTFPRRCVLIGSSNRDDLLTDSTGNRRWLPIHTGNHIDAEGVAADRDQLWAEAVALWQQSGVQWADAEALAKDQHAAFEEVDPWREAVEEWLNSPPTPTPGEVPSPHPRGSQPFGILAVLAGPLGLGAGRVTRREELRVANVLRQLGYERRQTWAGGRNAKLWHRIDQVTG